ncbi:MFS transporter [Marivibrio halodurans]|uniref:MFS transporter n=1 Tax=Marivibrio halodurans TaxID=2039722 RepID=A0A8J7S7I6_9PROT|nr:MFS transporter [Marivibrio halodurans]MBP5858264.1 MFS transporter [Marivibrio halodurans]
MESIRPLIPLAVATCLAIVALGIVMPVLPFYVTDLGGGKDLAPLIFSTFSAAALVAAPFWGRLSDRIGRRPVLLVAIAATVIAYLWLAAAHEIWELFASRAFAGATAGWMAASQAYVADVTAEEDRAKGMGLLGAAFGIGFTIGPGIGGVSVGQGDAASGYVLPALLAAGFAAASLLVTFVFVKEPDRLRESAGARMNPAVLREPMVARLLLLYFLVALVFTALEGVFAVWGAAQFDLDARDVSYYLVFAGVITVIIQGGLVGRLSKRFGEARIALAAGVVLLAASLVLILVTSPLQIYLPMALLAIGMGLNNPACQSLLSRFAPKHLKGSVLGSAQSAQSLARIMGPAWAAWAFGALGPETPFMIGAVVMLAAIAVAVTVVRRVPAPMPLRSAG